MPGDVIHIAHILAFILVSSLCNLKAIKKPLSLPHPSYTHYTCASDLPPLLHNCLTADNTCRVMSCGQTYTCTSTLHSCTHTRARAPTAVSTSCVCARACVCVCGDGR